VKGACLPRVARAKSGRGLPHSKAPAARRWRLSRRGAAGGGSAHRLAGGTSLAAHRLRQGQSHRYNRTEGIRYSGPTHKAPPPRGEAGAGAGGSNVSPNGADLTTVGSAVSADGGRFPDWRHVEVGSVGFNEISGGGDRESRFWNPQKLNEAPH